MPIRLKPYYDLKPCILDLSGIEEITRILAKNFPGAKFSANRGALQIYDETRDRFIEYISKYDSIESFSAKCEDKIDGDLLNIEMIFDEEQAKVSFDGSPEHENWIDHFISDINKQLRNPSLSQKLSIFLESDYSLFPFLGPVSYGRVSPYCRIILKQKPPSPFWDNIKANILSNAIWVILGMAILYILQYLSKVLGLKLNI